MMAFYSYRSGNREIWVRPVERGAARQLTQGDAESVFPAWSPDGKEIAFERSSSDTESVIYAVPVDGGEPRRVASPAAFASYSPDGKTIYVTALGETAFLAAVPATGGELEPLTPEGSDDLHPMPSRDSKQLYFFSDRGEARNIWVLSLEGGATRAVTDFYGRRGRLPGDAIAVGDDYIYCTWADATGDLWIMDVVEGDE